MGSENFTSVLYGSPNKCVLEGPWSIIKCKSNYALVLTWHNVRKTLFVQKRMRQRSSKLFHLNVRFHSLLSEVDKKLN